MSNYITEKVLRCTPDGSIINLEAQSMQQIVDECLESIDNDTMPCTAKCARLLNVAKTCLRNKYYHTALDLYRRAIEIGKRQIYVSNSYVCLPYCYEAAKQIDAIWRKIAPGEKRVSEYARLKFDAMSLYDDHKYCYQGIDNEYRFNRIKNYGKRHHIIDDDWQYLS